MLFLTVAQHYIHWHYATAPKELRHVAKNLIWFLINFFSLPQLTRSLFSPYRRITEERGSTFNFEDFAGYIIVNLISRIIGLILRLAIILSGLMAVLILCLLIVVTYVFWFIAPLVLLSLIIIGIRLLIIS
jgi:hypothetical protein